MKRQTLLFLFLATACTFLLYGCGRGKNQETESALENFTEHMGDSAADTSASVDTAEEFHATTADQAVYDFGYTASDYISVGDYSGIKVGKTDVEEVSEEDIQAEAQARMKKQRIWNDKTEGTVNQYDLVNMDISCTVNGQEYPDASRKDANIIAGAGNFFPEFESEVIGKQIGDTVKFSLAIPNNSPFPGLEGKTADFTVHIKAVRTQPGLTDETAYRLSSQKYLAVADYKEYLKGILEEQKTESHDYEVVNEVFSQISDSIEVKGIPEEETSGAVDNEDLQKEAAQKGIAVSELAKQYAEEGKNISSADTDELTMNLLLLFVAQKEGITVTGADISDYGTCLLDRGYTKEEINRTYTERDLAHLALNRKAAAYITATAER